MSSTVEDAGAFMTRFTLEPTGRGALTGLSFAVKDIFDVAGEITGCGSPDWAASHTPAASHAAAVSALLAAGARCLGKTISDEMAFSLMGENPHYGAPRNSADPRRVVGGSSSGSAAAVAAGIVDLALGSDTGGSVRAPASFCGIYGLRPSHGAIDLAGVMPFAASYDTVGLFAREIDVLARGCDALGLAVEAPLLTRLLLPVDAWAVAEAETVAALGPSLGRLEARLGPAVPVVLAPEGLDAWRDAFRICQGAEGWATHRAWIESARPNFGSIVAGRFAYAAGLEAPAIAAALSERRQITARMETVLADGAVAVLPTCPGPAPFRDTPDAKTTPYRDNAHRLLCPAGHAGLPQLSLPAGLVRSGPVGLSLLGPRGSEGQLIALARLDASARQAAG
ncbi:MAG: amidase [Pseudomonadota bacterium]